MEQRLLFQNLEERMAVVVDPKDVAEFMSYAKEET